MNISKRNTALDIVRIVAFFSVVAMHFPLHTDFYNKTLQGIPMLHFTVLRSAFVYCVPLFLMLSGYLLNRKTLSKRYYLGIVKTLGIYILSSLACMIFKHYFFKDELTFHTVLFGILDFGGANYSWYIEMYLGLFLLIPFLNLMYHGLSGKKQKKVLIWTLILLSSLPSILNIYNFTKPGWFADPTLSDRYQKLIPSWWVAIYPVTYYMIGAYFQEYSVKLKKRYVLPLIVFSVSCFGLFNFYRDEGRLFSWTSYTDWNSMQALILSVLIFLLFSGLNTSRLPVCFKKFLAHISDLCLGAYLLSYIADQSLYPVLQYRIPEVTDRIPCFIPMVLLVGITSLMLSEIINLLYRLIAWIITTIAKTVCKKTNQKELTAIQIE